jgi:hypothetical protein
MGEFAQALDEAAHGGEATAAADQIPGAEAAPIVDTVVFFEHPFFNMFEDMYFRLSDQTGKPVLVLRQGDHDLVLPFRGIRREFGLSEDSHDIAMLERVGEGLYYVKGLRIGDELPPEVVSGEASWEAAKPFHQIAYHRLLMQLVTWFRGKETLYTNPEELFQIAQDPEIKGNVKAAFREAAAELGLNEAHGDGERELVRRIELLAEELSYIEALRGTLQEIKDIYEDCRQLQKTHQREISMRDLADPVCRLMERAITDFAVSFADVDEATASVIDLSCHIDARIDFIRTRRNDLYRRLRAWDQLFEIWDGGDEAEAESVAELLRLSYRFLAPRYMEVKEWALATKPSLSKHRAAGDDGDRKKRRRRRGLSSMMRW